MLSQIVRNNTISGKDVRTKATMFGSILGLDKNSEEIEKLSEYIKKQTFENENTESIEDDYICENPNEVIVDFSEIYKEKKEHLPFFKSVMAQLQAIYG